jgi:hypothetical protein
MSSSRFTPVREDFSGPRWCTTLAASPMLAGCMPAGAAPLPPGWRRDAEESGSAPSRLVLPPTAHPFWRSADVAAQTRAMFDSLVDEKDATSAELATTLVRARKRLQEAAVSRVVCRSLIRVCGRVLRSRALTRAAAAALVWCRSRRRP